MSETHNRDTMKDKKAAQRNEPPQEGGVIRVPAGHGEAVGDSLIAIAESNYETVGDRDGAVGEPHGIDEWLELIESQVAERLNAKAGRTVYNPSGANVETHSLDCAHCLTDYTH